MGDAFEEMAFKVSVLGGVVGFSGSTVTRKVVCDDRSSRFAQQFDDAGTLPGVGKRSRPTVDEEYRSRFGHGG